ncbi:MAG: thioesterase family protein [Bacteroidota bacterium]
MNTYYTVNRKVRFGDCDPMGVLYTPRIGYFIVEAILDCISTCLGSPAEKGILDLGVLPPARALKVDFLAPMAWDDELEIRVFLKEMRTSALVFSVDGFVVSNPVFKAELTQVCIHPETKRPVKIPTVLRKALSNYSCA